MSACTHHANQLHAAAKACKRTGRDDRSAAQFPLIFVCENLLARASGQVVNPLNTWSWYISPITVTS